MFNQSNSSGHPDVMVSSTYNDLTEHREAVCDALLRLGFFPVGMEYDSAKAGKDIIASSLEMVARARAYVGILSHRYGGVPHDAARNPDELSITELEYREALKRGIPAFMFLMSDEHPVKWQDVEPSEAYQAKLKALKADARRRSVCATFSSVEELTSRVLQSMSEFKAQLARTAGTARGQAPDKKAPERPRPPHLLASPTFISGHEFVGRRDELARLDEWATSSDPLLVMEAIGGAGKSTLAWQWLTRRATATRPDLLEFAQAIKSTESTARVQWYLMSTYRITGQFEKARVTYDALRQLPTPKDRAIYRAGDVEDELCWLNFYQGKLADKSLDEAEEAARAGNNRGALRSLTLLRGESALERGSNAAAIAAFESAVEMAQAVGLAAGRFEARLALAKARAGERESARHICDRLHESERPPHVELAAAYLALGDRERAGAHARAGYAEAWADGPPYSRWWELKQCRAVLKSLGEPEPLLPPFDPRAVKPLPNEEKIRSVIADKKGRMH